MPGAVGFIGLGNMGRPMALNLVKRGFALVVHDIDPAKVEPLRAQGAKVAQSSGAVAAAVDRTICIVETTAQAESVIAGDHGIIKTAKPGHVVICMLETRQAFARLDEIASVPGIDAMTIGPTDLAQNLGVLGTPAQRDVLTEHRTRLVEAARKHGKSVAMITDSVAGVREMIALGATIINYSSDAAVLRSGYASVAEDIRRTIRA